MMKSISYMFRWRSVVGRVMGILVAMVFLLAVSSEQSGAQTMVQAIAAGAQHCLALMSDGTMYAWGSNWYGELGINSHHSTRNPPVQVVSEDGQGFLSGVQAIAAGSSHSMAAMSDGTLYTWGLNNDCQLGISYYTGCPTTIKTTYSKRPYLVDEPPDLQVQAVAGGAVHSLALAYDSTVYAWGGNGYCQLGVGSYPNHSTTPLQVLESDGETVFSGVQAIAAGYRHSLALMSDGTVYAWGANDYGQLGTNSTHEHDYPIQVQGPGGVEVAGYLSDVKAVAAGEFFSMALKNDGTVWAWGGNSYAQIDATLKDSTTPEQIVGLGFGLAGSMPPGEKVPICHKPGTPAEKTLYVPYEALRAHLRRGDTLGACQ